LIVSDLSAFPIALTIDFKSIRSIKGHNNKKIDKGVRMLLTNNNDPLNLNVILDSIKELPESSQMDNSA